MAYIIKSSRRSEGGNTGRKILFSLLFIALITFLFLKFDFGGVGLKVFSPALKVYNSLTENIASGFGFLAPKSHLIEQNESLKNRISELEIKLLALEQGRELTSDIILDENRQFVRTFILSAPPQTPYDTLLLDKGANQGVKIGDDIFIGESLIIGKIEEVGDGESKAKLFTAAGTKSIVVLEDSGELVEIEGQGGGSFKLELPKEFEIRQDEYVFSPGEENNIVAKVKSIKNSESSPFLIVLLQIPIKVSGNTPIYIEIND